MVDTQLALKVSGACLFFYLMSAIAGTIGKAWGIAIALDIATLAGTIGLIALLVSACAWGMYLFQSFFAGK